MNRKPLSRFRLSVEALDDRCMLSVIVGFSPDTGILTLTSNTGHDTIRLENNGAGHITGSATGAGALDYGNVNQVLIDTTGAANERIFLFQQEDALNPSGNQVRELAVNVKLGPGNNICTYNFQEHEVRVPGLMVLGVFSSTGNDTISFFAQRVNIASGSLLVWVFGGSGSDTVSMDYSGVKKGSLNVLFDVPSTDPIANNTLRLDATFDAGSRHGPWDGFTLDGGRGNDNLELFLHDAAGIHASGQIDGGGGLNTATHFDNVKAVNCQRDIVTHVGGHAVKAPPLGGGLGHVVHF